MDMVARKISFLERVLAEGPIGLVVEEHERDVAVSLAPATIVLDQNLVTGRQVARPTPRAVAEVDRLRGAVENHR